LPAVDGSAGRTGADRAALTGARQWIPREHVTGMRPLPVWGVRGGDGEVGVREQGEGGVAVPGVASTSNLDPLKSPRWSMQREDSCQLILRRPHAC
jgi:hypothetical protein